MSSQTYDVKPKRTTLREVVLMWVLAAIAIGIAIVAASVLKSQASIITVICVSGLAIAAATAISFNWADQPSDEE